MLWRSRIPSVCDRVRCTGQYAKLRCIVSANIMQDTSSVICLCQVMCISIVELTLWFCTATLSHYLWFQFINNTSIVRLHFKQPTPSPLPFGVCAGVPTEQQLFQASWRRPSSLRLNSFYPPTSSVRFCLHTSTLLFSYCQPLRSRAQYQSRHSRSIPASEFHTDRASEPRIYTSSRPRSANHFRKHTATEFDTLSPCRSLASQITNPRVTTIAVDTNRKSDNSQQTGFKSSCKPVRLLWRYIPSTGRLEVSIQCISNTANHRSQFIVVISIASTNAVFTVPAAPKHSTSKQIYDVTLGPIKSFPSTKRSSVLRAAPLSREETIGSGT
jgi:hypothetical protein